MTRWAHEGAMYLFILLCWQEEFDELERQFQNHPHIRLVLRYEEEVTHNIYAAADIFVIPSLFEPCGLTQMYAMRYGAIPVVRKTGGLADR